MINYLEAAEILAQFRQNTTISINKEITFCELSLLIYLVTEIGDQNSEHLSSFLNVSEASVKSIIKTLIDQNYLQRDLNSNKLVPTENTLVLVDETLEQYMKLLRLLDEKFGSTDFQKFVAFMQQANDIIMSSFEHRS